MSRRMMGVLGGVLLTGAVLAGGGITALAMSSNGSATSGTMHSPEATLHGRGSGTMDSSPGMMGGSSGMMGSGSNMMESGSGMMGSGSGMGAMTRGGMGGAVQATSPVAARALSRQMAATATVDRQTNTITYHTDKVMLVALASPEGGPDMTWNIAGLVNPTVVIPRGAHVTVRFLNADAGTMHGWELTTTPPPYASMAMMDAPIAFHGALAMPVDGATPTRWLGRTTRFTAALAGTYYYLCPVPGHARTGMHGTLVVR